MPYHISRESQEAGKKQPPPSAEATYVSTIPREPYFRVSVPVCFASVWQATGLSENIHFLDYAETGESFFMQIWHPGTPSGSDPAAAAARDDKMSLEFASTVSKEQVQSQGSECAGEGMLHIYVVPW